jgi:hypothetical protein
MSAQQLSGLAAKELGQSPNSEGEEIYTTL